MYAIKRSCDSRRNRRIRRRNAVILFDTQEDFFVEDHGPVIDHPIWYINIVGLQQSIIDSITLCKYRKDEGLIDGAEATEYTHHRFSQGRASRVVVVYMASRAAKDKSS
ncbi:ring-h2 finger protein atl54 [Quercus suber]|uniref:Ring-h2 finger protein atl54 n=1 Tax=Quercus suber TaxID=58331 RepID=A0AAW0LUX0_QUESU